MTHKIDLSFQVALAAVWFKVVVHSFLFITSPIVCVWVGVGGVDGGSFLALFLRCSVFVYFLAWYS